MRRALIATVAGLAVAGAAAAILVRATRPAPIVMAQAQTRSIEARLSEPAADRWRPYDAARGREEVRVDVLAALEKRGDWRGVAGAYLLAGERERAAAALAKAGASADAESDRAALALVSRDPKAALAHATRALQLAPGHAQATWNRALALRDLALPRTATSAFQAIAAHGAPGWGAEAKERAQSLQKELRAREESRRAADVAGQEMLQSGLRPAPEVVRDHPALFRHYLEQLLALPKKPPHLDDLVPVAEAVDADGRALLVVRLRAAAAGKTTPSKVQAPPGDEAGALRLTLQQATSALQAGRADEAEKQALGGLAAALQTDVDRELPRRFLVLLAEVARARGESALADAYVEEARQLI